jgi:hypothetical protein
VTTWVLAIILQFLYWYQTSWKLCITHSFLCNCLADTQPLFYFCVNIELSHTDGTVYYICTFPATAWNQAIIVLFAVPFSTQLPEPQPLFTFSVLAPMYCLKSSHCLQFPCLYPTTVSDSASISNFYIIIELLKMHMLLLN